MPPKGSSTWDNAVFLNDLALVLYEAAHQAGGLGPAVKEAESLRKAGHDISWEAIRPAMAGRQLMKWDPVVHEDILLALFQHISLTAADWAKVMAELRAKGYSFTENALRLPSIPPFVQTLASAMSAKPTRGWDASSHEALLLALIDEVRPNKAMLQLVTQRMRDMGYSYSYDAINQHVQKLRKNRDVGGLNKAAAGTATPRKTTPSKAAGGRKRKTPSKRGAKELSPVDDEDEVKNLKNENLSDDEALPETPVGKRVKTEDFSVFASDGDNGDNGEI